MVVAAAIFMAACGGSDGTPSSPTTAGPTTESFELQVPPGGAAFYSFTMSAAGTVTIDLQAVQASLEPPPIDTALTVGVGVPSGEGCAVTESMDVTPALTSQFSTSRGAGIFCVDVADPGTLTQPVLAQLRFTHP
jgi:hypothetical protein